MARAALRHPGNVPGPWFVDERCIDCGTCREIDPETFGVTRDQSIVIHQPDPEATGGAGRPVDHAPMAGPGTTAQIGRGSARAAWLAAQACPTQSIGTDPALHRPGRLYPNEVAPGLGVYDCGYCSPDSFGATSWFVARPDGNLLVDSPRWTEALAGPFEDLGGIDHVLLTHRDDVADAERWAERFGARVWIHEDDRAAAPFASDIVHGTDAAVLAPGVVGVPVPGHTRGSMLFVVDDDRLFTGDSLAWDHDRGQLTAFRGACWYSWPAQTDSLGRVAAGPHRFSWVLPGHGAPVQGDPEALHDELVDLAARMGARR
jgi:glyoxylase-like metal-dependent hydrolase (beta-lactamase superfamily II)/ferredoxin